MHGVKMVICRRRRKILCWTWLGAVPPAPMIVSGISNCPPVVAYVFPADEISAIP